MLQFVPSSRDEIVATAASPAWRVVRIGEYDVNLQSGELQRRGARTLQALPPQPFAVLLALIERQGEVVTRDELQTRLWPDATAGDFDHGLHAAVKRLRDAFNDSASEPRYIQTLPRRGYRLAQTPTGIAKWDSAHATVLRPIAPHATTDPRRSWRFVVATLAISVAISTLGFLLFRILSVPGAKLRVSHVEALTQHDLRFPPFPSEMPLATDGNRLYFTEWVDNSLLRVRQMPVAGGESTVLPLPLEYHQTVAGISPDGRWLLAGTYDRVFPGFHYWAVATLGESRRRLTDIEGPVNGHGAVWTNDDEIVFCTSGGALFRMPARGGERRQIATLPGVPMWPAVSPDGRRVRLTTLTPETMLGALWEVGLDGREPHPLLPGWSAPSNECCGAWTPDGRFFVFQAFHDGRTHLWVLDETYPHRPPEPLTSGAMEFRRPLVSRDGRSVFAVGGTERGELARYDAQSRSIVRHEAPLSAEWVDFTRDGRWMTYSGVPEHDLWWSQADGSQRMQLSFKPMQALIPRWSPDGEQIAFTGWEPGHPRQIYVVSRNGSPPRDLIPGDRLEYHPSWSPDGRQLAIATEGSISIVDIATGDARKIEDSDGLAEPNWSPDGTAIVAIHRPSVLRLFDVRSRRWTAFSTPADGIHSPTWTRDSQHVYFVVVYAQPPHSTGVYRLAIRDGHVSQLFPFRSTQLIWSVMSFWLGLKPDDSPLFLRDVGTHDIYALRLTRD